MNFTIIGTGSYLPKITKTNDDIAQTVDTSDEWIKKRTGIENRHICVEESLSDISGIAAKNALLDAGISADELDLIICSTIRGDYISPSQACVVQGILGASCPAFDINAACSGFVYALDIAEGYLKAGKVKKVLIVSADAMTKMVDWNDRSTCVLFGDGAGAMVLSSGNDLLAITLTAKSNIDQLNIPNVDGNSPFGEPKESRPFLYMDGGEIYKFAVSSICNDLNDVMKKAGVAEKDISYVLTHQANMRIINAAQSRLNLNKEKFLINIHNTGNTSSASIPILIDEGNKKGIFKKGDLLAMSAFGGGFTTGACIIRWNK